ncbi:MAG: hypothetical protein EPO68_16020 [Planctomycetota bacterium]|nr:MAG: hypothetical protein EPO68_16020 [Planctomycetota bacterium]
MNVLQVRSLLVVASAALVATGCQSSPSPDYYSHWNPGSLGPRTKYHLFGYRQDKDGSGEEFAAKQTRDFAWTWRRHFNNDNPTNPWMQMAAESNDWPYTGAPVWGHFAAIGREVILTTAQGFGTLGQMTIRLVADSTLDVVEDVTGLVAAGDGWPQPPAETKGHGGVPHPDQFRSYRKY